LFVAGLSMGGVLALYLATQKRVDGVISMCTPIWVRDRRAGLAQFIHYFYPYKPRLAHHDPEIESQIVPYDRTPIKSVGDLMRLIRLMRRNLSQVTVPTLVVQARNDETIEPKSADYIIDHVAAKKKKISWYEKSCHIITLDKERGKLFKEVEQFILENSKGQ
jgi:carboxylesterase